MRAFDADPADASAIWEDLRRQDRWPVFTVDLVGEHKIFLVFRNYEGDAGWDYLLEPAGTGQTIVIAALEGHFRGPALRWPELTTIAGGSDEASAARLLFLLPAMADANLPPTAIGDVAAAVRAVGGRRSELEVAPKLIDANERFWGAPPWEQRNSVPVCLGGHSFRGPGQPTAELRQIADMFSGRQAEPRA
jgi:hypothetical protein